MYSPFYDQKGKALTINQLKYHHLEQLMDCDEGHHLEFKKLLEDNGKAQLAKEIASFANCEGGWLIIGMDDKTREIVPIDRIDYSQKIGKIACRISPMPEFETRFLPMPEDKNKGVLVVYVYEGVNAPYICNGSVYVRSGSSKEPVKPADRGNIEYLYERSRLNRQEVEAFCHRDYYYAYNKILMKTTPSPIANIYLKNLSAKKDKRLNYYKKRDEVIAFVKQSLPLFEHISYSMNSIIFMHKTIYPGTNGATFIFELYYDWSCKISIPLGTSGDDELEQFRNQFNYLGIRRSLLENFKIANGTTVCNALFGGIHLFASIAKKYKLKAKDYAFCTEFENIGDMVLAFHGTAFNNYIKTYGVPYAHKETNRTKIDYFNDGSNFKFDNLAGAYVVDYLAAAFGYRSDSISEILRESNAILLAE